MCDGFGKSGALHILISHIKRRYERMVDEIMAILDDFVKSFHV